MNGRVDLTDEPGFGLELNPAAELVPYSSFFSPVKGLGAAGEAEDEAAKKRGAGGY